MYCGGRALVQSIAPVGPVMVTWANFHYLDFVLNWVEHVKTCGIKAFLVGAMDDRILQVRTPVYSCRPGVSHCMKSPA